MGINRSELNKALKKSFSKLTEHFEGELNNQLESVKWDWPRLTKRRNGEIAGFVRNIIDTGELKNSLIIDKSKPTEATFTYTAEHSALVHEGGTVMRANGSRRDYPARPWISQSVREGKLVEKLAEYLEEELNS